MPRRLTRRASSLALLATLLAAALPGPALGLEPPRPLPSYRPDFVTEIEAGLQQDCLWASAAMLLDKWTNGDRVVSRRQLRALSGDRHGGSNFGDVRVAFARLGMAFRYSPDGGDRMSWNTLLARLSHGAGAIVLGDDSALPRSLGRWDPAFWRKSGEDDNHAMYVDRYDRRTGRVFLMDPLAPAGWRGEWVSVHALRAFIWKRGGAVFAATTPTARPAPFAGVTLGQAVGQADRSAIQLAWPVKRAKTTWRLPGLDLHTSIAQMIGHVGAPDENVIVASPAASGARATGQAVTLKDRRIAATFPTPSEPGVYRVGASISERRFGRTVAATGPWTLYVPGERWAEYSVPDELAAEAGDWVPFAIAVTNRGTTAWTAPERAPGPFADEDRVPHPRLVGTWVPSPTVVGASDPTLPAPSPVDLGPVPLGVGDVIVVQATVQLPTAAGRWTLMIDVVDDVAGSYTALGSAPGRIVVEVGAPLAKARIR
jgi:hypothetical protein